MPSSVFDPTNVPGSPNYDPVNDPNNSYGYIPSLSYGIAFVVLFAISTIGHAGQTWFSRRPWLLTLVAGGLGEVLGWSGRLWAHYQPDERNAFMVQIVCLVICPAFFSAAVYAILGWIIIELDPSISLLRPALYWKIFISCDVLSLIIQSAGGGIAASAPDDDRNMANLGSNIMLAGIIFQFVTTIVFSGLFAHFLWIARQRDVRAPTSLKFLIWGEIFATAMVILRGLYRVVELAQGWNGYLLAHEPYFLLDAIPMLLLMWALNATHPCSTLPLPKSWARSSLKPKDVETPMQSKHSSGVRLTRTESA